jgi:serine/threonine protein kinase
LANLDDPDVTVDDTQLTPDPDATLDDVPLPAETGARVEPEFRSGTGDPDATYIRGVDVSSTVKEWENSLSEDVDPEHTLKAPPSTTEVGGTTLEHSVVLKQRDVSRSDESGASPDAAAEADYQIEQLLGEGGMGVVYAARQQSMDRPVAIKVLKSRAARLKSSQQSFVSEAIITGGLDHPNIVPIYDVGKQADDALFYAMKQVEGVEWKDRFAEHSVSENLDILLHVSDAIAFAHARCIIHRDLKPANIMLGAFGEVLVMDWGLAMPTQDHPRRDSFPRAKRGGTPHYMAPEMAADPVPGVDRRSDVYLLGGILFEIVTGKAPHVLDSPPETRREHVKACLVAVAQNVITATDESGELIEIARKALATDPADRYQAVPEFQAAIREYLAHEESIELAARAADRLDAARQSQSYDEFSRARFGFEAALEEWSGNERATAGLQETRHDYASTAFDRGDFDLALSLLDETDAEQTQLGSSILQAIVERDARQQHIRRLRRLSFATSLGVAIVAAVWINTERNKAEQERTKALTAHQEEATQRGIAQKNEREARKQQELARQSEQEAQAQRLAAVKARALAETSADEARRNLRIAEQNAYHRDMRLAQREWSEAHMDQLGELLDRYRNRDDLKGFEWSYWDRLTRGAIC